MDELKLREEQVVTPVSVEELTRALSPAQAASVLGQAIRSGGQFFATSDGDVVLEGRPGQSTRVIKGIRHEAARQSVIRQENLQQEKLQQDVEGVDAEPIYAVNLKA